MGESNDIRQGGETQESEREREGEEGRQWTDVGEERNQVKQVEKNAITRHRHFMTCPASLPQFTPTLSTQHILR